MGETQALLEAMEQQCISIAKGGVVCTLPARTAIIAAANPAGGHYNKNKTVAENLKMGQPLLSRFDLVFILLDKPNEVGPTLLLRVVRKIMNENINICNILCDELVYSKFSEQNVSCFVNSHLMRV